MSKILVAVVSRTRARFLILEVTDFPDENMGARLVELDELLNPLNEASGQDLWSSTKTGRNQGAGGQAHSYDDHRVNHVAEFERRFVHSIATHTADLVCTEPIQQLILVAESQLIGSVREAIAASNLPNVQMKELTKNLCHLKPLELHTHLANHGLIPRPQRITNLSKS